MDLERGLVEVIDAARRISSATARPAAARRPRRLVRRVPRAARAGSLDPASTSPRGRASSSAASRPRSPRSTSSPGSPASSPAPGPGTRRSRTSSGPARRASWARSRGTAARDVRLSSPVARIEQDGAGVSVTTRAGEVVLRPRPASSRCRLNTWRDIEFAPGLSERKRQAASEGHTGHSTKVWALVENAPDHLVGVGWGGGLNWLSTEFTLPEGSLMVGFGTGPEMLDVLERRRHPACDHRFIPGARVLATDAHDWNGDEFSRGTWMAHRPGQLSRYHSAFQETEDRLAFAGSDLALGWAGLDGRSRGDRRPGRSAGRGDAPRGKAVGSEYPPDTSASAWNKCPGSHPHVGCNSSPRRWSPPLRTSAHP